jgi:hypothetical protein
LSGESAGCSTGEEICRASTQDPDDETTAGGALSGTERLLDHDTSLPSDSDDGEPYATRLITPSPAGTGQVPRHACRVGSRCAAVFLSHQQTIGTTAVQLELPTGAPGTDYRSGFSVVIKHNGAAAILIGSAGSGMGKLQSRCCSRAWSESQPARHRKAEMTFTPSPLLG